MKSLCVQLGGLGSVDSDVIYDKSAVASLFWTKKLKKIPFGQGPGAEN